MDGRARRKPRRAVEPLARGVAERLSCARMAELSLEIESPQPEAQVRRVFDVWRERCPVYLALTKPTPVATSFKVL